MKGTGIIFRREFGAYFNSPIAYIFIIAFLIFNTVLFMTSFFVANMADLRQFFTMLPWTLIFFQPAISMRLWAEDKRLGTFELLMTLPVSTKEVMLGKYLAAFAFYLVSLAGTLPLPLMVMALGNPDVGAMVSGYIGAALVGGLFLAIGTFTSGLVRDQISAVILGMLVCALFSLAGVDFVASTVDGWVSGLGTTIQKYIGVGTHYGMLQRGILAVGDLAYFLGLTALFLVLNTFWLEGRKY